MDFMSILIGLTLFGWLGYLNEKKNNLVLSKALDENKDRVKEKDLELEKKDLELEEREEKLEKKLNEKNDLIFVLEDRLRTLEILMLGLSYKDSSIHDLRERLTELCMLISDGEPENRLSELIDNPKYNDEEERGKDF